MRHQNDTPTYCLYNDRMQILYNDEAILVVNKPAGVSVLPDGWKRDSPYLVKILEEQFGKIFIVHRLDKITSGVMIFAHTIDAHRDLNSQFEKHRVEKIYHAIVTGVPGWDEAIAKYPLRIDVGHRHRTMVDDKNGKLSETRFKVLRKYSHHVLVEAMPASGRTHQVRVHAYALGYPLLGDVLYGAPKTDIIARPALHAYSLSFTHPHTQEYLTFTAPYPADFESALRIL